MLLPCAPPLLALLQGFCPLFWRACVGLHSFSMLFVLFLLPLLAALFAAAQPSKCFGLLGGLSLFVGTVFTWFCMVRHGFDTVVAWFWHNVGLVLGMVWLGSGVVLALFRHDFVLVYIWFWFIFGTMLERFWHGFATVLHGLD